MSRTRFRAFPVLAVAPGAAAALAIPAASARADLTYVTSYGTGGNTTGVAVSNGLVYASDITNDRVVSFNPTNYSGTFTSIGAGQFNYPAGLAVSDGLVYLADADHNRIDQFNPTNFSGTFTSFGTQGSGRGAV